MPPPPPPLLAPSGNEHGPLFHSSPTAIRPPSPSFHTTPFFRPRNQHPPPTNFLLRVRQRWHAVRTRRCFLPDWFSLINFKVCDTCDTASSVHSWFAWPLSFGVPKIGDAKLNRSSSESCWSIAWLASLRSYAPSV